MEFILKNSRFFKDVLTLMTGTTASQILAALFIPLLSRLYLPEEMGLMAFFWGICAILAVIFTGRYELAIVLPKNDKEAYNIANLSIFLTGTLCFISFLILSNFAAYLFDFHKYKELLEWVAYIPIAVFFVSLYQIINYLATRARLYKKLSISAVSLQFLYIIFAILFGIYHVKGGLILSRILSYGGLSLLLVGIFFGTIQNVIKNLSVSLMKECAFRYKQFLLCNVPYSSLGAFSKEFIVFAFVAFGYTESAGFYALARNVLYLPVSFLSSTLGQVFYKESVEKIGTPELEQFVLQLITSLIIFAVPGLCFFMLWAPHIFAFCFGEAWREAGIYASIFSPAAFLFLFTSWPERLYEITQTQYVSLSIQFVFDSASIFILFLMMYFNFGVLACIIFYTIFSCIYHVYYLFYIFKVSKFDFVKLLECGERILLLALGSLLLYMPSFAFSSLLIQFLTDIFLLLGYYLLIIYINMRPRSYTKLQFLMIQQA